MTKENPFSNIKTKTLPLYYHIRSHFKMFDSFVCCIMAFLCSQKKKKRGRKEEEEEEDGGRFCRTIILLRKY